MKKEKTVRTYQRRTKSGKMVTVHEHKASYDAAEEARKAAAKKAGAGSELSKKKAVKEESPLGFSADDYKEWYHWDMEDDANNEAALRVEKALTKKMGKKAYNKYLEDMSNSYSARGHKKAHQALLDEHTAQQKKQDAKSKVATKDIVRDAKDSSKSSTTPKKKAKDSDLVEHYDQFNKKSMGKAVGDSFTFSEGKGKDKFTYDARFVTDGKGRYGYVVRDKAEGPDAKYYVGISDGYERHSQLPAGLRKAAEAQGLRFKNGEFVKKETKGDRAVARMNKLVNEALSSTTSDPKALKKQLGALIDYNGGPVNRGDKVGKRIDEIREQLGKRSSKKRVDKKSDYDYETSMKNLENYFAEERRKITSKGKKKLSKTQSSTTSTTGAGADWSKATVDKVGREYGGGYTIVGTPNDSLWSSTNFRTKSQALDFIKRKQKESSAKSEKAEPKARKSISPFSGQAQLKQEIAMWKKSPTSTTGKASRNNIIKLLQEKKKQGYKLTKREEAFLGD